MAEQIESKEIPVVQNEVTKKLGYVLLINGMVLADIAFVATVFFRTAIPEIAMQLIMGKILLGCLLLGYIKYLKN